MRENAIGQPLGDYFPKNVSAKMKLIAILMEGYLP